MSKGNCTLIQLNYLMVTFFLELYHHNFKLLTGLPPQDVYWFTNGIAGARKEVPLSEMSSQVSRLSVPSSIDQVQMSGNSYWIKILLCFSAKRSASLILKLDDEPAPRTSTPTPGLIPHSPPPAPPSVTSKDSTTTPPTSLGVIHGLRVVTMAWIILGHTYGLVNPQIHSEWNHSPALTLSSILILFDLLIFNGLQLFSGWYEPFPGQVFSASKLYTDPIFQPLLNATLSVDTFFFISGLLTIYVSYSRVKTKKSLPFFSLIGMRYIRLTPSYASVIAFSIVFPLMSSGPIWRESVNPIAASCYHSWWTNLLYINNFVSTDKLVSLIILLISW